MVILYVNTPMLENEHRIVIVIFNFSFMHFLFAIFYNSFWNNLYWDLGVSKIFLV